MSYRWKVILSCLVALLAVGYIIGSAIWVSQLPQTTTCSTLTILIQDENKRQYLTRSEIVSLLQKKNIYPIGKQIDKINLQEIENATKEHPMVRTAECYTHTNGEVVVTLTQRVPILRVIVSDGSYFVDSDRTRMPIRASVIDKVMPVVGEVGQRMACEEIADLAVWIAKDKYWRGRIGKIRVRNPKYIELIQYPDNTVIILGDFSNIEEKMHKLRCLYEDGFENIGWQEYREYDLRYKGQVIGRK